MTTTTSGKHFPFPGFPPVKLAVIHPDSPLPGVPMRKRQISGPNCCFHTNFAFSFPLPERTQSVKNSIINCTQLVLFVLNFLGDLDFFAPSLSRVHVALNGKETWKWDSFNFIAPFEVDLPKLNRPRDRNQSGSLIRLLTAVFPKQ